MHRTDLLLRGLLTFLLCQATLVPPAEGQDAGAKPTLNLVLDTTNQFIAVTFSGGKPDAKKALDVTEWRVIAVPHDQSAPPVMLSISKAEFYERPNHTTDQAQVRLKTSGTPPIPTGMDLFVVQFDPTGVGLTAMLKSKTSEAAEKPGAAVKQNPDGLVPATSKQSAAIYFSGLYSPGIGSPPQYSIDAVVNPQFHLSNYNPCDPRLGLNAQVKTDKRPTVDPDSYTVSPSFSMFILGCGADNQTRFSGRSVLLTWNVIGPEFEAKGKDLNVVSAPMISDFFRLWPLPSTATNTKEPFTAYLSPTIGLEFGTNTKNGLDPGGSGTVFRGVAGADLSARYLLSKTFVIKKILLSSSYRARIPAFSEISTNTVMVPGSTKPKDIFSLSSATRNHVQSELDFMFTDAWGITLKHEYGRIPPAFRLVDNTASVGLVFMFSQAGNGKQKGQQ